MLGAILAQAKQCFKVKLLQKLRAQAPKKMRFAAQEQSCGAQYPKSTTALMQKFIQPFAR